MPHSHYRQYMLLLLILLGVSSTIDRGLIALAVEPIKAEFQLGDAQIGLMNGFAFALFYAFAGIPIARWADRGNRNHVLTVVAALWSVMVVLSSMVTNFAQLLVVRVGVAVGESGCIPAAQSLISDYYSREERPKAIAIFWLCIPIATLLSFIGGGWLIEQVGWRYAFMIVGLPGLLLAILVKTTLREPRLKRKKSVAEAQPSFKSTLSDLWNGPVLRQLVLLYSLIAFFWTGISIWLPAFYMRSHGMSVSEVGVWIGLSIGCGGLLFTYLGGHLATRYAPGKESLQMKAVAFIMVLCVFFAILCWLPESKTASLVFMFVMFGVALPMTPSPIFAAVQNLVEARKRAVTLAVILMISQLFGMGLGPMAVGLVSDLLEPSFGQESLRYALLLFSPGYLWCAYHAWKASGTIEQEILAVESANGLAQVQSTDDETTNPQASSSPVSSSV